MELANLVWYNRIPSVYEQLMSVGDNSMSSLHTGTIDKNYFHYTSLRCQTNKYTRSETGCPKKLENSNFPLLKVCAIDWCAKNLTQLWIWPFYDNFSQFFTSYINIFYKTKVQTVILRCLTSLNLNWIKSYYMNHKHCVFQFWKKKTWKFKFQK